MEANFDLIPLPRIVRPGNGDLTMTPAVSVVVGDRAPPRSDTVARVLAERLRAATGFDVPVRAHAQGDAAIVLELDSNVPEEEGYRLEVTPQRARIGARTAHGLFHGAQTLRQLLPPEIECSRPASGIRWTVPAVEIEDAPRFAYRGMHLDVGRHFFPVDFIKRYLDLMAAYKMSTFHWHLTEDQGWRLEIKKYPKLTEVGGFRKETVIGHARDEPARYDGQRYGGFYTQDQASDIVRYAEDRFITVIPEIEMPGHSLAALAAYPELGCTPGPFEPATTFGIFEDIYSPSEKTFAFLQDVLSEVIDLFPSEYIHIGGDEAPKARWKQSDVAREVISREGLRDEEELQSWFIRRIESFLMSKGRRIIGWDEILEGGLAPEATVMSWRGVDGGIAAAKMGHQVIMTPATHVYFDHYQADPQSEPLAIGGYSPLEHVYTFDPVVPQLSAEEAAYVLGGQANVWTEYMKTSDHVEYMVLPRMLALAETLWSPRESRNFSGFLRRLRGNARHLDRWGVRYARHFEAT
jgi:hexosaminidase